MPSRPQAADQRITVQDPRQLGAGRRTNGDGWLPRVINRCRVGPGDLDAATRIA